MTWWNAPCRHLTRIPVILDCDPGTDDALALLLALASPEIELLAVTVAGGNVGLDRTLPNALALVALAAAPERPPVPVFAGADRPLLGSFTGETRVHGVDGLGGVALPPGGAARHRSVAADAIRASCARRRGRSRWSAIAPVTNLALALITEPALAAQGRAHRADERRLGRGQRHAGRRIQRAERPRGAGHRARLRPARRAGDAGADRAGAVHAGAAGGAAGGRHRALPAHGVRHPGHRAAVTPLRRERCGATSAASAR